MNIFPLENYYGKSSNFVLFFILLFFFNYFMYIKEYYPTCSIFVGDYVRCNREANR